MFLHCAILNTRDNWVPEVHLHVAFFSLFLSAAPFIFLTSCVMEVFFLLSGHLPASRILGDGEYHGLQLLKSSFM